MYMPFTIEYNKDRDATSASRRQEKDRETKRELGVRIGSFEAGYRATSHTRKLDERRKEIKEKVRRTLTAGLRPQEAPTPA